MESTDAQWHDSSLSVYCKANAHAAKEWMAALLMNSSVGAVAGFWTGLQEAKSMETLDCLLCGLNGFLEGPDFEKAVVEGFGYRETIGPTSGCIEVNSKASVDFTRIDI
ncbi:unnamed protein product [Caretta caretta]